MADHKNDADSGSAHDGSVKPHATVPNASPAGVQSADTGSSYQQGGRSEAQRSELEKNVADGQRHRPVEQSPGLHSTGSFTGVANGETGEHPERK